MSELTGLNVKVAADDDCQMLAAKPVEKPAFRFFAIHFGNASGSISQSVSLDYRARQKPASRPKKVSFFGPSAERRESSRHQAISCHPEGVRLFELR
jgi:hypothetical protein